jgi:hypothetical protein
MISRQPPQIQGLLSGVPNDGMIILDLFSDVSPVYNRTQNYYGKQVRQFFFLYLRLFFAAVKNIDNAHYLSFSDSVHLVHAA